MELFKKHKLYFLGEPGQIVKNEAFKITIFGDSKALPNDIKQRMQTEEGWQTVNYYKEYDVEINGKWYIALFRSRLLAEIVRQSLNEQKDNHYQLIEAEPNILEQLKSKELSKDAKADLVKLVGAVLLWGVSINADRKPLFYQDNSLAVATMLMMTEEENQECLTKAKLPNSYLNKVIHAGMPEQFFKDCFAYDKKPIAEIEQEAKEILESIKRGRVIQNLPTDVKDLHIL